MASSPKTCQEAAAEEGLLGCDGLKQIQGEHPPPHPSDPFAHTSNQLEGTAEHIQGAHEQVEKSQEQNEFPNPLEDTEDLPFGVSLWGRR